MPNVVIRAAAIGLPIRTAVRAGMRRRMENAIERLIAALDAIDGDPDLEPSLGSVEGNAALDAEDEHDGCEPDADEEPTIGWSESESESGHIRPCGLDTEDHEPTARETFGKGFPADPRGDDEEDGHHKVKKKTNLM